MSAFEYQLSRSIRRKSISIVVRRGQVKVMAPVFVSGKSINDFVRSKTPWVLAKLNEQQSWLDAEQQAKKQYISGETFLCLGEPLTLSVRRGSKTELTLEDDLLDVVISNRVKPENQAAHVEKLIKQFYQQSLTVWLEKRIEHYAQLMQVTPTEISVRSYKRRWGSCSSKGVVSFNYLLMMAPDWVIDYVVVHELAHLIHMNHSAQFWALVTRFYPDHQAAKDYLKLHGPLMLL